MLDDNYIPELVKKAAEFGEGKIHIIVNNVGQSASFANLSFSVYFNR